MPRNIRKIATAAKPSVLPAKTEPVPTTANLAQKAPTVPKRAQASTPKYNFSTTYSGEAPLLRARPSKTRIRVEEFGTATNTKLSTRTAAMLDALRREYGTRAFERRNLDAGVLKALGRAGLLRHVDGDPAALDAKFALTAVP